jgi:hypothetical protein
MNAPARLIVAGRIPPRRPGDGTPIASCERLARFCRDVLAADRHVIGAELRSWRDREGLALSDALLAEVAAHVAREARTAA